MVTKNLQDVLFKVDLHPVYTVHKKKPELFAGYAVINLDENKILKTVSDKYELRTNSDLIESALRYARLVFDFAHYNNDKSYFHIYFVFPDKVSGEWQWAVEIINAYDCKTAPKLNVAFKHIGTGEYLYTNIQLTSTTVYTELLNKLSPFHSLKPIGGDTPKHNTPIYIKPLVYGDMLLAVQIWQKKSHQLARNWLADEIDMQINNLIQEKK